MKKPRDKAWEWFSKYYRLKSADKAGYVTCYTCGKVSQWNDGMQTGHLLDGRVNSILLCEDCVRCQCVGCNMFKSGNKEVYIPKFIDEEGKDKYEYLVKLKKLPVKMKEKEWLDLRDDYKRKARKIAEAKGLKV